MPGTTVIMTGGVIRSDHLRRLRMSLPSPRSGRSVWTSPSWPSTAFRSGRGLTYPSFEEVATKRAIIDAAARVILLADHSKFGREAFVKVAPITAVDAIVTTPGIDPAEADAIRALGIELIEAPLQQRTLGVMPSAS